MVDIQTEIQKQVQDTETSVVPPFWVKGLNEGRTRTRSVSRRDLVINKKVEKIRTEKNKYKHKK